MFTPDPLNTLVIAKHEFELGHSRFKLNTNYRLSYDEDMKGCLVFGEWMTLEDMKKHFTLYIPVLQERLKALGLIVDGKPISKKAFIERAMVHTYGSGKRRLHIFTIGEYKENCFAFYPMQGTKPEEFKQAYEQYVRLVAGDYEAIDDGDIVWGNMGIPLAYGNIRRDEAQYIVK